MSSYRKSSSAGREARLRRKATRLADGLGFVRVRTESEAERVAELAKAQGVETVTAPPYGPHEGYELRVTKRTPVRSES